MDPLFERRELMRTVHITAPNIQRNIQVSLLSQLRMKHEGICLTEGYVRDQSITVVDYSLGRVNLIKGGLDYTVKFQADMCMPHAGQVFKATVVLKSKIGLHAETAPLKVLLPRDLHLGNEMFESVQEKQEVEFEIVGARFQQGDDSIVVLGSLRSAVLNDTTVPKEITDLPSNAGEAADLTQAETGRKKVTVAAEHTREKKKKSIKPSGNTAVAPDI